MHNIVVQKYGGSSVATKELMAKVASKVQASARNHSVVVVVSAMGDHTDQLTEQARQQGLAPSKEMDALLVSGEHQSCALLSTCLDELGVSHQVMHADRIPIRTNANHGSALIESINPQSILRALDEVDVIVVPGFQGVHQGMVTTLGRGGSDLSAVALAASLGIDECEIYTDVHGVMTADPRLVPEASTLQHVSYDEMIAFSYAGARVLQPRCVVLAKRYNIAIKVSSAHQEGPFTKIDKEDDMENRIVSGVATKVHQHFYRLGLPCSDAAVLFDQIKELRLNVLSCQYTSDQCLMDVVCDQPHKQDIDDWLRDTGHVEVHQSESVGVVSAVGTGLRIEKSLFFNVHKELQQEDVPVFASYVTDGHLQIIVHEQHTQKCVRFLHAFFQLEKEPN